MKIKLNNYTFNPSTRTITLNDFNSTSPILLSSILMVTNVTSNTIIYLFNDASKGGAVSNDNTLSLIYDTTSMSSTDSLQIWVDTGIEYPITQEQLNESIAALKQIYYAISNPAYLDKSANQLRAQITGTISTLTTLTTCTTVTNLTNMGKYTATMEVFSNNNAAWSLVSRSTLA